MPVESRESMVERQLRRRGITDEAVLAAMARVLRELFVPEELRDETQRRSIPCRFVPLVAGN